MTWYNGLVWPLTSVEQSYNYWRTSLKSFVCHGEANGPGDGGKRFLPWWWLLLLVSTWGRARWELQHVYPFLKIVILGNKQLVWSCARTVSNRTQPHTLTEGGRKEEESDETQFWDQTGKNTNSYLRANDIKTSKYLGEIKKEKKTERRWGKDEKVVKTNEQMCGYKIFRLCNENLA